LRASSRCWGVTAMPNLSRARCSILGAVALIDNIRKLSII
jgi:hypothetical protein